MSIHKIITDSPDGTRLLALLTTASRDRQANLAAHARNLAGVPVDDRREVPLTHLIRGGFVWHEPPHGLTPLGILLLAYRRYGFLRPLVQRAVDVYHRGVEFDPTLSEDAVQEIHANFRADDAPVVDEGIEEVIIDM